jgi:RimJ/RimL family protein N-acetyltransferase
MPSDTPFLKGDQISLRAFRQSDLEAYKTWLDNEEVTHFLEMGARPTREKDCEAFLQMAETSDDAIVFAITETGNDTPIGTCGLYLIQWVCQRAQLNILVGEPSAWDKGYGSEAVTLLLKYGFYKLNLNSIQLGVNADNQRAIKSYEKGGFVHEGRRRQMIFRNSRYYDVVEMSILRSEYDEMSSN